MSAEVTTSTAPQQDPAARLAAILGFITFVVVWGSLIAGALLSVWTLAEVRDFFILLVGLHAGTLAQIPAAALSRIVTVKTPPIENGK